MGAAAAAARLLRLSPEQTAMAVSLAASQASGLRQNFGTMTKPYHAGAACRAGVNAAKLVQAGFTASSDALEGRFGFMRAFSGGSGYDPARAAESLGSRCFMVESGIEIKKYPCCGSAHLALDATSQILRRESFSSDDIDRIDVLVDFDPPRSLIHSRPTGGLEGKFSMQYCLAAEIIDGQIGLATFTDEQVMRTEAQDLIPVSRCAATPDSKDRPAGPRPTTAWRCISRMDGFLPCGLTAPRPVPCAASAATM